MLIRRIPVGILCGLICAGVFAGEDGHWNKGPLKPVPEGARLVLKFDRESYFLGEDVVLHVELHNDSTKPFEFSSGRDYRGASRSLRFKVSATDNAGHPLEDPHPHEMSFGGFVGFTTIDPGGKNTADLHLMRYRNFDAPGTYAIRVTHDFGWEAGPRHPVGETKITFKMPDKSEAEKIISHMEDLVKVAKDEPNRYHEEVADFTCLRYPVYLQPLSERAWQGSRDALTGLGAIETPDATRELIKLLDHPDASMAVDAALALIERLPIPVFIDQRYAHIEERRMLSKKAWNVRFGAVVREHAMKLIESADSSAVKAGALVIEAVGVPEDRVRVRALLDRKIAAIPVRSDDMVRPFDLPETFPELMSALFAVSRSGVKAHNPATPGEWLVWIKFLPADIKKRPRDWRETCASLLKQSHPFLRSYAMRALSDYPSEKFRPEIVSALHDEDMGMQCAACMAIANLKDASFANDVLSLFATTRNPSLYYFSGLAAVATGKCFEVCESWADKLDDKDQTFQLLTMLADIVVKDDISGYGGGVSDNSAGKLQALKARWKAFLAEHEQQIRSGQKFQTGGPELTPDLFDGFLNMSLRSGGNQWPPAKNQ